MKLRRDDADELGLLMAAILPRIDHYLSENTPNTKLLNYLAPSALRKAVDLSLPDTVPASAEDARRDVLDAVDALLRHSVRTSHARFWNRLYSGSDPVGQVAEFVTAVLNTSPDTYAVAPLINMVHEEIVAELAGRFGFLPKGTAEGIFVPGGSYANLMAMTVARNIRFPQVRREGLRSVNRQLVIFTSEHAHFSIARAAMILGFGDVAGCRKVPCDGYGRMSVSALKEMVTRSAANGDELPFMVCLTAGTTVLGAFDPVEDIADFCKEQNLWLHVDASWGGAVVFSNDGHDRVLRGVPKADSITFNPHKLLGVPLQCSVLLMKKKGLLESAVSSNAEYLYHGSLGCETESAREAASYDIGDRSLQCGRRADAIKMWLAWKRYGASGFGARVDHNFKLIAYMTYRILSQPETFRLVAKPVFVNLCFWLLPESSHDPSWEMNGEASCPLLGRTGLSLAPKPEDIDDISVKLEPCRVSNCRVCELYAKNTLRIHQAIQTNGHILINYSTLPGVPAFFRFVGGSPAATTDDIDFALKHLCDTSRSIAAKQTNGVSH
eukprot:CAMPEP_0198365406 /NCGR_PEP_ID=MMETSP1450-20131203/154155_1 /TAXON_ID=753684 ORGANISM="Madagascaria erythrocladiodes, Strain CCMP3234" /NCGR_SAMPLE_ID=MMETSP1450 /ASSEMBLY_ACC=CAM_ASM_001115 /LENGTH=552 /DNA_ID=CAMNT_0044072857 /DNA_START=1906 /DNA_END=3564 /DNA_ORIENTATION=-